jgi:hypothetical protein
MAQYVSPPQALPGDAIERAAMAATVAPLLTPAQVGELLAVSERTLERWRMTGEGPEYVALSRKVVRYDTAALAAFLEGRRRMNTAA